MLNKKKLSAAFISVFLCTCVFLLLGEVSLRIYYGFFEKGGNIWLPDDFLGLTHAPNYRFIYTEDFSKEFAIARKTNHLGLVGEEIIFRKPKDVFRILILGDSFTEGMHVREGKNFCEQLQNLLNSNAHSATKHFEVINAGVAGYSPISEYLFFKRDLVKLSPDIVILELFPNDVFEDNKVGAMSVIGQDGLPVKMTVSCETINSLAEGIVCLQEKGFKVGAGLGYDMPWDDESVSEYGRQLHKLAEYYLEHAQTPPVSLLDLPIQQALRPRPAMQKKYCGTGTHMATYDVDGKVYPCHLFMPLVLGTAKSADLQAIKFQENATVTDRRCDGCVLGEICPTCYGFNYKLAGDVALRDQVMCRLFKEQALANCWYQVQLLKRKRRRESLALDEVRKAKACLIIMEQLSL